MSLDQLCVWTLRFLAADAVQAARSGHPGAPMGAADLAHVLWSRHLRFDPDDPSWINRDRFVLSAGHASMLLYGLLHLYGFRLSLDDIRRFRQLGSATPGHPEFRHTAGVEATTGPLGQGLANAVGMAMGQRMLRARLRNLAPLLDHRVYVLASDGDLMEGVASEAASLAGHWGLGNLICIYDDNRVTIDGPTALAFSEDVAQRFAAYGWRTERIDGHDHDAIDRALAAAASQATRPTLLVARTTIGKGAPTKEGTAKAHGEPLGEEEIRRSKEAAGWPLTPPFHVPDGVGRFAAERANENRANRAQWQARLQTARRDAPEEAEIWDAHWSGSLPDDLEERLVEAAGQDPAATRKHSARVIQAAAKVTPRLIGGAADLAGSVGTGMDGAADVAPEGLVAGAPVRFEGRTLRFGVREHAMGAILNGLVLHGAFRPFGGTFLVFSDYMRPSIRLAALSRLPVIYLFSHDSVFLGEDGPTHQPVEQLASLRLIPGLSVWRPADGPETAIAWSAAMRETERPTAIILTRQAVGPIERPPGFDPRLVLHGAYVALDPPGGVPAVVIVASGSEVSLAIASARALAARGIEARVVSAPCIDRFQAEPQSFRTGILPPGAPTVVLEAARTDLWCSIVGRDALRIGIEEFGMSAPAEAIRAALGFSPEQIAERIATWRSA